MKPALLLLILVAIGDLHSQTNALDRLKGLRLYGNDESQLPIVTSVGDRITIEFDVLQDEPPNLYFQFLHCDKRWKPTDNLFVNDPVKLRTRFPLPYRLAPDGVERYRYSYRIQLPAEPLFSRFEFSGNYILELRDGNTNVTLARARFFVAEWRVRPNVKIMNRSLPANTNPYNQALQIDVQFFVPDRDSVTEEMYIPFNVRTVDIIRNKEVERTWRIDADDSDPETSVEGYGLSRMKFTRYDVPVGTEYRQIDLRNVTDYPAGNVLRSRQGADVSRFQHRPGRDADGAAIYRQPDRYADYIPFQFELRWDAHPATIIHVVGDFNGWRPGEHSRMIYDGQRFVWKTWLRRGVYDYQYVVGDGDWIRLEGNDWRSASNFTAVVYYRDTRFGGFDRILGVARARNSGSFD